MLNIDPKFQKWFDKRKIAQKSSIPIPTQNANPTLKAGPKNSNGKTSPQSPVKVKKAVVKKSVGRPVGMVRASNNPSLNSRKG